MMTDVPNVSETPSVVEAIPSEMHSYETVEVLYHQAKQAVESQTYDRTIEVLIALDKGQYEGKIDFFRVFDIIQDLWTQAPHEAQKLRALDFQTFVIKVEGTRVGCTTIDNSESRLFYFKPQTTENAQNLIGKGTDLFEKEKLAAVAVMEKKANWNDAFSSEERAGGWGFALYNTDGTPKDNSLDCATCHKPLQNQDFRFSHGSLVELMKNYK